MSRNPAVVVESLRQRAQKARARLDLAESKLRKRERSADLRRKSYWERGCSQKLMTDAEHFRKRGRLTLARGYRAQQTARFSKKCCPPIQRRATGESVARALQQRTPSHLTLTMLSRNLIARFLPFGPSERRADTVSLHVEPDGDGLSVFIRPDTLTDDERKAVWLDLAASIEKVIESNLHGVRARVVVPDNGFEGVLQYTWAARTGTGMEARLVWADICALCPLMSLDAMEAIKRRRSPEKRTAQALAARRRTVRR
jgi:hypothetical protein